MAINPFRRPDKAAAAPEATQTPAASKKQKAKDVDVILPDQIEHLKHMLPASLSLKSTHLIINNIHQTVLLVTKWPSHIDDLTLTRLYQLPDVTILLDINKRPKGQTITEISKSMDELQSRSVVNTSTGDDLKDQYELQDMMQLHSELILGNEYMVSLTMRLVVTAPTEKALKTRAENLKDTLANEYGIQTIIPEFEMEDNLRAMLFPANSVSQPFPVVGTLARQYMFSQQDHADPAGSYFGHTASGGRIILDPFRTTHNRTSYDLLLMGLKGSGKSVSLKAMIQDMVCQGHRVLTLDVEGEQIALANALGGVVVRPGSGATSAQINPLEIRPRGLSETSGSDFGSEISRIESFFYQYAPDLTDKEAEVLKQLLQQTYLIRLTNVRLEHLKAAQSVQPAVDVPFSIRIDGALYTEDTKQKAGSALLAAIRDSRNYDRIIGQYKGLDIKVRQDSDGVHIKLLHNGNIIDNVVEMGMSESGNLIRLENAVKKLPETIDQARERIRFYEQEMTIAKAELEQPFARQAELDEKSKRLAEIDRLLNADSQKENANIVRQLLTEKPGVTEQAVTADQNRIKLKTGETKTGQPVEIEIDLTTNSIHKQIDGQTVIKDQCDSLATLLVYVERMNLSEEMAFADRQPHDVIHMVQNASVNGEEINHIKIEGERLTKTPAAISEPAQRNLKR